MVGDASAKRPNNRERRRLQKLEKQQLHLNIGLDKLRQTAEQVAEMQESLGAKDAELKQKDAQANLKLQEMVEKQNEAEGKKGEAEKLSAELAIQDAHIAEQKAKAECDLAEAEPALLDAQASVRSIKKAQLDEVLRRRAYFEPVHHEHFRRGAGHGRDYEGRVSAFDERGEGAAAPLSPFATSSDVDLFLVGLSAEEAHAKVRHIHNAMQLNLRGTRLLLVRTGSAITFVAGGYPQRFVQVVLKLFDSPTDVRKPDPPKLRPSMRGAELHTWYPRHPLPKRQVEADLKAQRAAQAQKT